MSSTVLVSLAVLVVSSSVLLLSASESVGVVVEVSGAVVVGSVAVAKIGLLRRIKPEAAINTDMAILFNHLPIAL